MRTLSYFFLFYFYSKKQYFSTFYGIIKALQIEDEWENTIQDFNFDF